MYLPSARHDYTSVPEISILNFGWRVGNCLNMLFPLIKQNSAYSPWGWPVKLVERLCGVGKRTHKALWQEDIMRVMSSGVREGFWRAGCCFLQPA